MDSQSFEQISSGEQVQNHTSDQVQTSDQYSTMPSAPNKKPYIFEEETKKSALTRFSAILEPVIQKEVSKKPNVLERIPENSTVSGSAQQDPKSILTNPSSVPTSAMKKVEEPEQHKKSAPVATAGASKRASSSEEEEQIAPKRPRCEDVKIWKKSLPSGVYVYMKHRNHFISLPVDQILEVIKKIANYWFITRQNIKELKELLSDMLGCAVVTIVKRDFGSGAVAGAVPIVCEQCKCWFKRSSSGLYVYLKQRENFLSFPMDQSLAVMSQLFTVWISEQENIDAGLNMLNEIGDIIHPNDTDSEDDSDSD